MTTASNQLTRSHLFCSRVLNLRVTGELHGLLLFWKAELPRSDCQALLDINKLFHNFIWLTIISNVFNRCSCFLLFSRHEIFEHLPCWYLQRFICNSTVIIS